VKRQNYGAPKARCEVRLPTDLDLRLDKLAAKAGVTRTSLMIAAIERFVYGEETQTGVETIHERVAVLTVGQEQLRSDLLEVRAYLDALGQKLCHGSTPAERQAEFDTFLAAVETAKAELMEIAE
jgi:predicted transcriptional regulator